MMMDSAAAPIAPGTQTISTDVKVVFSVKSGN
jgi:uncharacterized protein YggE